MPAEPAASTQRIDQWLWFARIVKSRTLAQELIERGKVRLNRVKVVKPSTVVKPGDGLTLVAGRIIRSFEIVAIGVRRGPAREAQLLYRDLTAPQPREGIANRKPKDSETQDAMPPADPAVREQGAGRPTKRDRREIEKFKRRSDL
ncbi:RNA-binding protein [Hyphomicrobium methylovorum]|uniref:RNA-binding S4 domain-containing protein n=1 Tax=Hyphomicrobium methylovorum TaxID=84 RepID=UPI0015E773D7|nr:RNA-binding S4 domain-containing protein [Hyphomicrobium methylovorum]MBA2126003.1 RNA-binding protein [Hyphomicrobium methylovorum]